MAVPDGSASKNESVKHHTQCSEEIQEGLKELVLKRKGTTPADAPIIKKSKTVCPVEPFDDKNMDNTQRNNGGETSTVAEQGKLANLQGKLSNQQGKVPYRKVPSQRSGPPKPGLLFGGQGKSVSSVPDKEQWNNCQTKEPILSSPVSKATPHQLGVNIKETTACRVDRDVVSINGSPNHLDRIYGERGKHCEMVLTLSQTVEPEDQSDKIPKFDQLLKKPEGVYKKLHDMVNLRKMGKEKSNQQ